MELAWCHSALVKHYHFLTAEFRNYLLLNLLWFQQVWTLVAITLAASYVFDIFSLHWKLKKNVVHQIHDTLYWLYDIVSIGTLKVIRTICHHVRWKSNNRLKFLAKCSIDYYFFTWCDGRLFESHLAYQSIKE